MSAVKPIQIFKAGRHTAASGETLAFSAADLEATAKAYDPKVHEAPLVVGHPDSDSPAYGWVSALHAGDGLEAETAQVDPAFAEMVNEGRFKHISASFYRPDAPRNPTPGIYYLRHVGFLGAQAPAVKGLRAAQFSAADEGIVEFSEESADEALWSRFRNWLFHHLGPDGEEFAEALDANAWHGQASDFKDAATYCDASLVDLNEPGKPKVKTLCHLPVKTPEGKLSRGALFAAQGALVGARGGVDLAAKVKAAAAKKLISLMKSHSITPAPALLKVADFSEEDPTVDEAQLKQREAEIAKQEAAFAEREQKIAAQEKTAARAGIVEFVEGLAKQGKVLPRQQGALVEFLAAQHADPVIEYTESAGAEIKKVNSQEWLKTFLAELPARVNFEEVARREGTLSKSAAPFRVPPGYSVDGAKAQLHAQALAYAEEHKVNYITAVMAISGSK